MGYYDYYFQADPNALAVKSNQLKNLTIYKAISEYLEDDGRVVELGVGKGFFGATCKEAKRDYYGVESNVSQCEKLAEAGLCISHASVPPIPFGSSEFVLLYTAHLIEHLPGPERAFELLVECYRVLVDGGILAILFPNYLQAGREFWNADYTHQFPTTETRIRQLLADTNFVVLRTVKFRGPYKDIRRHLIKLLLTIFPRRVLELILGLWLPDDLIRRAWLHLQEDVLVIAKKRC